MFLFLPFSLQAASLTVGKPVPLSMEIPYGQLTLTRAQQLALQDSPQIAEMLARIDEAKTVAAQARTDLWPTISIHAAQNWQAVSVRPDWSPEIRVEESLNHLNAGIEVNWLLFDGFSRRAAILAAKAREQATKGDARDTCRLLAESVAGAFYQAQLAAEAMQIARQNALFNRTLEDDAEKRCQTGNIPEAEYLNFSVKSLQAENNYLRAEQSFSVICTVLAKLMALPEPYLSPEMFPERGKQIDTQQELPELTGELAYAMKHRPDVQALSAEREALLQDRRNEQGKYAPRIYATGSYDYDQFRDYGTIDQNEHGSTIGVRLNWDLFNGRKRSVALQTLETKQAQLQQQYHQKELEIQAELQEALIKAKSLQAVCQREQYTLTLVRHIRDHVERSYRAGAAPLTRLNEAQSDLVTVSAAVASSRISYLQQLESLDAASGRILEDVIPEFHTARTVKAVSAE